MRRVNGPSVAPARVLAPAAFRALDTATVQAGVLLGRDSAGAPVHVRLFGPQPMTVTFVGGWWAAQILISRCLAHGATVHVEGIDTPTPGQHGVLAGLAHWLALDAMAGGGGVRVRPAGGQPSEGLATMLQPLLYVRDLGQAAGSSPSPQPWRTDLTVLAGVTPASHHLIASADLVLAQRLAPPDAGLFGSALFLGPEFTARITAMDNEMIAAFRGPAVRYVWLSPTALERQHFG